MAEPATTTIDFIGSPRFEVRRRIGAGGMGVVYEAFDRERETQVALKTLRTLDPEALLLFKNEFRALQDLEHPNLVRLGELIEADGCWFFTMELVSGVHFFEHVRSDTRPLDSNTLDLAPMNATTAVVAPPSGGSASGGSGSGGTGGAAAQFAPPLQRLPAHCNEGRLRDVLGQLAEGLVALHRGGKVHRDVKPSNILVTEEGRVVVLDFGLVADAAHGPRAELAAPIGTALYMAPEQAAGLPVGPEADWYAFGILLFYALVGRLPLAGAAEFVLREKQRCEPLAPSALVEDVAPDLDALCVDLLRVDPTRRPRGAEILARLGRAETLEQSLQGRSPVFVGRRAELERLWQAFADARSHSVIVCVEAESGVGKSALLSRFSQAVAAEHQALVLAGRCYERELVPYKAIDGIVDQLTRHLARLPADELRELLPPHMSLLSQLFPVLRRLEPLVPLEGPFARPQTERIDPLELRVRAFAALRALLARLAATRPLVLTIDDLQWSDSDSLALLRETLRPVDSPPLLLLVTVRPASQIASQLRGDVRTLPLPSLSSDEARKLALALTAGLPLRASIGVDRIAEASQGQPLFIIELVRHALFAHGELEPFDLREALWGRIAALAEPLRRVLELVVVCGAPLSMELGARAGGLELAELANRLSSLRYAHLVRTSGLRRGDSVEPLNEQVRRAVLEHLAPDAITGWHARLADALVAAGSADHEALATHLGASGRSVQAARHAAEAAVAAAGALAFDRAAKLFRMSLALQPRHGPAGVAMRVFLGEALANAGRGAEAAEALLAAAVDAPPEEGLDLRRRAADQLLRGGHFDAGLREVRNVLTALGMRLPSSRAGVIASLLASRARLAIHGLDVKPGPPPANAAAEVFRADICYSLGVALGMVDVVRGADFQTRSLVHALKAKEPGRIARGVALECCYSCSGGSRTATQTAALLARAEQLSAHAPSAEVEGIIATSRAIAAYCEGRWQDVFDHAGHAERILADRCLGMTYEVATNQSLSIGALCYMGRLDEMGPRIDTVVRHARERGDLFTAVSVSSGISVLAWLGADDAERARSELADALDTWSQDGFHVQHYYKEVSGELHVGLYCGDARGVDERVERFWPLLERSLMLRTELRFIEANHLRASCVLLGVAAGHLPARRLGEVERIAHELERIKLPWAQVLALLERAGVAGARGDDAAATALLDAAAQAADRCDMGLHAAAARRRRGKLLGGAAGETLTRAAEAWMAGHAIKRPDRMARIYAPGFKDDLETG